MPRVSARPRGEFSQRAEDFAEFLNYGRPCVDIADIDAVVALTEVEYTKRRGRAAPVSEPIRSVAVGLAPGDGTLGL